MRIDRWLNLQEPPAFLRPVQPRERAWWRILLTIVLWAVGGFLLTMLAFTVVVGLEVLALRNSALTLRFENGFPVWGTGLTAECGRLFGALAVFASFALAIPAAAALVNRRPMRSWLTAAPRFRWKLFLAAGGMFALVMTGGMVISGLATGWPDHPPLFDAREPVGVRLAYVAAALLVIPVAALAEELLTRGWLLQLTAAFTRNAAVIVTLNAVVFAALHLDANPYANLSRFYTGVVLGLIVLRLGGLEFAIGVHAANNLMVALFQQPIIQATTGSSTGGWGTLSSDLIITTLAFGLAEFVARWAPLRRWTGADQTLSVEEPAPRATPSLAASA